jgi:GTP cyclohydrolase IV
VSAQHTVYLGAGSNLGDRQANILQALQRLRRYGRIDAVSAYYDTPPEGNVEGPSFLNIAIRFYTELEPQALERVLRDVEAAVGRQRTGALAARPIDLDLLLFDDLVADFGRFEVPYPYLAERAFSVVPLAEIAPDVRDPRSGATIAQLAAAVESAGIERKSRSLHFDANRQDEAPAVRLGIDRAGSSGVRRIVRVVVDGREATFNAEFSMVADLAPNKAGVHMSRFSELLEGTMLEVLSRDEPGRVEEIVERIARRIVESQQALRADVRLRADFGLERWTPVSGKRGEETYTLLAIAHAGPGVVRRVVGVEAEGMTACPCAQGMMREHGIRELAEAGFTREEALRALDALPVATHNQRGRGSVLIGATGNDAELRAEDLVEIVENAMSSETYDLLKRPDEFFIVNKAHRNPRFVEDVVRTILAGALDVYADFGDDAFVQATQVNYESIHKHDAFAEASGTFGELRRELQDLPATNRTDLAAWLGTRPSAVTAP